MIMALPGFDFSKTHILGGQKIPWENKENF